MKDVSDQNKNDRLLTANVIGATGLVGKQLVTLLLSDRHYTKVRIFVRRDAGIANPKLEQHVVEFKDSEIWEKHLTGDVLFSALGTTLRKAGSKDKQYEVDFRLNLKFANKAKENGIGTYVLVSSIGADSQSKIFYSRIKGELDDAVINLGFRKLAIQRPSMLLGEREENRWMEKISIPVFRMLTRFLFKKYRPIEGRTVAQAMITASLAPPSGKIIWTACEIFDLAKENVSTGIRK